MTSDPQPEVEEVEKEGFFAKRSNLLLAIVAGLSLITIGLLIGLLIRGGGDTVSDGDGDGTPTPFASDIESSLNSSAPLVVGGDGANQISVTVDIPTTLLIDGRMFSVQAQKVGANQVWEPTIANEETAVWIYGTIINYVIGISDSEENRALLQRLTADDEILLTTQGGFDYRFSQSETVNSAVPATFAQNMPGITLMLMGNAENEPLVVNGRYILSEANTSSNNIADLGETVQLDNLQITVPSVAFVPDRPEAPAGFAFFQIDYEIQNVGLSAINTSILQLTLIDTLGNQYALSPIAGQVGNYPALSGFLNAGQTIQATAGYQIPLGLNSDSLNWVVARSDSTAQVQINVPFTGNAATVAQGSDITLLQVNVGEDLTSLSLAGQVTNLNTQPIVITESDIDLASGGAAYLLLATNPPFPWTVASGQTLPFNVTYQRPSSPTAVFTVLGQGFQLDGLR